MIAQVAFYDVGMVGEAFSYAVPEELTGALSVGMQVLAPVGNAEKVGIILRLMEDEHHDTLKNIISIHPNAEAPLLTEEQGILVLWIAWYYRSPLHRVLRLCIPEKIWNGTFSPNISWKYKVNIAYEDISLRAKKMRKLVELIEAGEDPSNFSKEFPERFLRDAVEKEFISRTYEKLMPIRSYEGRKVEQDRLTVEQQQVTDILLKDTQEKIFLLFGLTGSGKTHIYLHVALEMQSQGKQTLLLVPEIALTPQLIHYFTDAFGDRISVFHSHLSAGEKHQEWLRVKRGESMMIIGSRSAIFAPIKNLGAIVIDEEHEWTYKNEQNPRYHAKKIAEELVGLTEKAKLICGSATPSIESMYRAMKKEIMLLTLDKRIFEQTKMTE